LVGYEIVTSAKYSTIYILNSALPIAALSCDLDLVFVTTKNEVNLKIVKKAKLYKQELEYLSINDYDDYISISIRSIIKLLDLIIKTSSTYKMQNKYEQELVYMEFLEITYREHFKKAILELAT